MEAKGGPMYGVVSEDDTKIVSRLRYDTGSNNVMGLRMNLDKNGVPIQDSFKFTTLADVQEFSSNNELSSYAVTTLCPQLTTYHLVAYGTNGSDKAHDVRSRCEFVVREFAKVGIIVICKQLSAKVIQF